MILHYNLPGQRESGAGFTLLEMIVVIALIGILLTVAVNATRPVSPATTSRALAGELVAALKRAQSQALATAIPASLTIDLDRGFYQVTGEIAHPLPSTAQIQLTAGQNRNEASGGTAPLAIYRFAPDGSSGGGQIIIAAGGRLYRISIDWLTGRIGLAA